MDFEKFEKKEYFVNRELSWLKFDERVLSEARDKNLPLFDRLKFLSITASNLDEFFMVRVASLKDQVHAGYHKTDIAGMTAKEQLKEISVRTHELVHVQYNTLNRSLIPALEKAGMHLVAAHENLTEAQSAFVDRYFEPLRRAKRIKQENFCLLQCRFRLCFQGWCRFRQRRMEIPQ